MAGAGSSKEMLKLATARNKKAIDSGWVDSQPGSPDSGLAEMLTAAGFAEAKVVKKNRDFCALAIKQ